MSKQLTDSNFARILRQTEDITSTFDIDLGGLPDDILQATRDASPFVADVRRLMEENAIPLNSDLYSVDNGLIQAADWISLFEDEVRTAYRAGLVFAIDGTPLIHHQRFLTQQVYACAVGAMSSQAPLMLQAKLVKVAADLSTDSDTLRVIQEAEELTDSSSWPTAFMEYQERLVASELDAEIVMIDGSLVTQNLLTRREGRMLLRRMLTTQVNKTYVGIIKNISKGDTERRFIARALRTGEVYIHETFASFMQRDSRDTYEGDASTFLQQVGSNVLRGVFKTGQKAFGFECHRKDLGKIIALLWLDRNNVPGFEIPFLLAQVDAHLRGRYRPTETMAAIEASLTRAGEGEFFDELDERSFR